MMKSFILATTSIACFLSITNISIRAEASQTDVLSKDNSQPSQLDIKNIFQAINQFFIKENSKYNPNNLPNPEYGNFGEDVFIRGGTIDFSEVKSIKLFNFESQRAEVKIDVVTRKYGYILKKVVAKSDDRSIYNGFFATKDIKDNYLWKFVKENIAPDGKLIVERQRDNKWKVMGLGGGFSGHQR